MKLLGEPIFARDETGRLKSRIGTLFLNAPGLVTLQGVHATQRLAWIKELNRERAATGRPKLTEAEVEDEFARSVDLLFDDRFVLIRPDPYAMDLAFEADDLLQSLVSKRRIRFLNTQHEKIRNALRARGENWRMSRLPCSPEEMNALIAASRSAIDGLPIYFYNRATGTRFLTFASFAWLRRQPDEAFRAQLEEIALYAGKRNRFGYPEVDIFPPECAFTRQAFEALDAEALPIDALRAAYEKMLDTFRLAVPANLQEDAGENIEWRNLMCAALTLQPNMVASEEFIQNIAPEFFRQIEWLPGCHIEKGELIFDSVCEELENAPDDPDLQSLCDARAKALIFNYLREFGTIEYINLGRIVHSLSARPKLAQRRANVYIAQVKEVNNPEPELRLLRFQKWCASDHLDAGKDLLTSLIEAAEYTDYILDRRLACRQLGMNLPLHMATGRIQETYYGTNQPLRGARYWSVYFERAYIGGHATDKIPARKYGISEFNRRLAALLGHAAAINAIVGRAYLDGTVMFDDGDEVVKTDEDDFPSDLIVADHTGSFSDYQKPLEETAQSYAAPVNRRTPHMSNPDEFAECYLAAFTAGLEEIQQDYRRHRRGFDDLFKQRPIDRAGSIAYRWQCVLKRLDETDAPRVAQAIRVHIEVLKP